MLVLLLALLNIIIFNLNFTIITVCFFKSCAKIRTWVHLEKFWFYSELATTGKKGNYNFSVVFAFFIMPCWSWIVSLFYMSQIQTRINIIKIRFGHGRLGLEQHNISVSLRFFQKQKQHRYKIYQRKLTQCLMYCW